MLVRSVMNNFDAMRQEQQLLIKANAKRLENLLAPEKIPSSSVTVISFSLGVAVTLILIVTLNRFVF